jgi:hypothetical protein
LILVFSRKFRTYKRAIVVVYGKSRQLGSRILGLFDIDADERAVCPLVLPAAAATASDCQG